MSARTGVSAWYKRLRAVLGAVVLGLATLGHTGQSLAAAPEWPQAHSDLPADPAVRFGVLPNGMRYAIMRNRTPKDQVSMRFRLGVGSLDERDEEQGLAHFLEHMAFRGSAHVPEAEVWKGFQRRGMAIGADSSAYTQETQTFYQFDLPKGDAESIAFGLTRMRETASELTLAPEALETERGPVQSEERLRDTPDLRALRAQRDFLFQGLLLPNRAPIGKTEIIQHVQIDAVRNFYKTFYRPENATLIVVGDIDPDAVEVQIKARFSDWRAMAPARAAPDLGVPTPRGLDAKLVVDPNVARSILVGWIAPFDGARDTAPRARRDMIHAIGLGILNRRLRTMANGPNPPFTNASLARRDQARSATVTLMSVDDAPSRWRAALRAAEIARRQAVTYGVTQAEVDREVGLMRARMEAAAAGAATRQTPALARALLVATDEDGVFTSPAENLALFKSSMGDLSADEVSRALRDAFDGAGPLVFISSPIGIEGGEAAIKSAFAQIEAEPIAAPAAEAKLAWPYASFGPPGHVVERKRVEDLDATLARFANGVRLTVKPTTFSADQVLVNVQVGDGLLSLPKNRSTLRWAADSGALLLGGLKKIDVEDTEKVLSDKIYSLGFGTREDTMSFSGATRPEDLDTQMQVLAAYVTDPGFRPEAFEHVRSLADPLINDQDSSPGGVMQRQLSFLLHDGDPRWAMPTRLDVAVAKLDDMRAVVAPALAKGAIEITVVGNVSVDRVIAAVAATFGALPDRPATDTIPEGAREVHFPAGVQEPVRRYHKGRDDQAIFLIAWPSADMLGDFQTSRDLRILEKIINTRLFEQFRIADGVAYETDTALETSQIFPGYGYIYAFAEAPPAKQALFYALIAKITADLKAHPVSAEELERAKQPRVELFTKARQTNSYWLTALTGAQADPRRLEVLRTTIPALEHVTAADVQRLARTYLTDEHAWKMTIEPQGLAPKPDPAAPKATGTAVLNCARASDNRLGDCHVVQETPPGIGVGAQALMMVPNLTVDPAKAPPSMGGRIQFTLRVRAPDPGA